MQVMDVHGGNEQIASGRRYWKVLALCLALTACQAPSTPASAEAAAAAGSARRGSAGSDPQPSVW